MRLIDADALDLHLKRLSFADLTLYGNRGFDTARCEVLLAPTIDAVPVVRCKDCDLRKKNTFCLKHMHYVKDDYFCATGAKMDGDPGEEP